MTTAMWIRQKSIAVWSMLFRWNSLISISLTHFDIVTGCLAIFEFHAVFLVGLQSFFSLPLRETQTMAFGYRLQALKFKDIQNLHLSLAWCNSFSSKRRTVQLWPWIHISKIWKTICPIALHAIRQLVKITFLLGSVTNLGSCYTDAN